jgi:DNA-binding transcriptional MerR regulator
MARRRARYGEMVTRIAAAAYLGVTVRTLDRYRKAGLLHYEPVITRLRFDGRLWYRLADLNEFLRVRERKRRRRSGPDAGG